MYSCIMWGFVEYIGISAEKGKHNLQKFASANPVHSYIVYECEIYLHSFYLYCRLIVLLQSDASNSSSNAGSDRDIFFFEELLQCILNSNSVPSLGQKRQCEIAGRIDGR